MAGHGGLVLFFIEINETPECDGRRSAKLLLLVQGAARGHWVGGKRRDVGVFARQVVKSRRWAIERRDFRIF